MEEKDLAVLLQKAEELLGRPLAPKDDPAFLRDLRDLSQKDPALAKALVTGAKSMEKPAQAKDVQKTARKAEAALRSSNRSAQIRESIRRLRDRIFGIPMSLMGRRLKVPNKRTVLLAVLLGVGVVMGMAYMLTSTPQREKKSVTAKLGEASATAIDQETARWEKASVSEMQGEAERLMGKPVPAYGTPEYEAYVQELSKKNPILAEKLKQAQAAQASLDDAKQMASQDLTGLASGLQGVPPGGGAQGTPGATQGQGGTGGQPGGNTGSGSAATPAPPAPVPPPPPPPNATGTGSGSETGYGYMTLAAQAPPRPLSTGESGVGQGQAQGQGQTSGGSGASRFLFVETGGRQALAQGQEPKRQALASESTTGRSNGSPQGGPGPGMPGMPSGGSTMWERQAPAPLSVSGQERSSKGVLTVLAEAPKERGSPETSPAPPSSQQATGVPGMGFPPVASTPSGSLSGASTPLTPPASSQPQASQSSVDLPYTPGRTYTARLNFQLVVAEGGSSPVVLEGADGSIFTGTAKLDPALGRVMVDLDTAYLHGKAYPIKAMVYDNGQLGLSGQIREEAPTLAQDIIRATASGFSRYVDLLSKQSSVSVLPGGGMMSSQQAPPLEYVLLGEVGRLFSVPDTRKSLVRLAQVDQGKVVQVLFLGGR